MNRSRIVGQPEVVQKRGSGNRRICPIGSTPVPKAGGLAKTTLLFSTLLLKQNNLVVIPACGWLCANVPICLFGGHKSWHSSDIVLALVLGVPHSASPR